MQSENLKKLRQKVEKARKEKGRDVLDPSDSEPRNVIPLDSSESQMEVSRDMNGGDGFSVFRVLLGSAFFYRLFEHIANRQFDSRTTQLRVSKMRSMHPRLYRTCVWADFIMRALVLLALAALAVFSAIKILS